MDEETYKKNVYDSESSVMFLFQDSKENQLNEKEITEEIINPKSTLTSSLKKEDISISSDINSKPSNIQRSATSSYICLPNLIKKRKTKKSKSKELLIKQNKIK